MQRGAAAQRACASARRGASPPRGAAGAADWARGLGIHFRFSGSRFPTPSVDTCASRARASPRRRARRAPRPPARRSRPCLWRRRCTSRSRFRGPRCLATRSRRGDPRALRIGLARSRRALPLGLAAQVREDRRRVSPPRALRVRRERRRARLARLALLHHLLLETAVRLEERLGGKPHLGVGGGGGGRAARLRVQRLARSRAAASKTRLVLPPLRLERLRVLGSLRGEPRVELRLLFPPLALARHGRPRGASLRAPPRLCARPAPASPRARRAAGSPPPPRRASRRSPSPRGTPPAPSGGGPGGSPRPRTATPSSDPVARRSRSVGKRRSRHGSSPRRPSSDSAKTVPEQRDVPRRSPAKALPERARRRRAPLAAAEDRGRGPCLRHRRRRRPTASTRPAASRAYAPGRPPGSLPKTPPARRDRAPPPRANRVA